MIYLAIRYCRTSSRLRSARVVRIVRLVLIAAVLAPLPFILRSLVRATSTTTAPSTQLARLSDEPTIRTAHLDSAVNLTDGHNLVTAYSGPDKLRVALEQNQAEPLSLASADFDEDGVPDLVSGYSYDGQGIVTLLRGNIDAMYPNTPEALQRKANGTFTNAPFLSPARAFAIPVAADFIGAGDFDADGHWDVVVAARLSNALFKLAGDGRGNFTLTRQIELPGRVTAMATGEINRADGLTDVVVGIEQEHVAEVLVFEGPIGALRSNPEALNMPAPVSFLQLGQFDGDYARDLAAGAGTELIIVQGRDRKLSLDAMERARVPAAAISERQFDTTITTVTSGNFAGDDSPDLAVGTSDGRVQVLSSNSRSASVEKWSTIALTAGRLSQTSQLATVRVSTSSYDDLIIADEADNRLQLFHGTRQLSAASLSADPIGLDGNNAPVTVLPMRLTSSALDSLIVLQKDRVTPSIATIEPHATFTVVNTNATGAGSLQFAILDANETPGADVISFNIPGTGPFTISPTASLPTITEAVTIDSTTQPGYAGQPLVIINGTSAGNDANAFSIASNSCLIRGFRIQGYKAGGSVSPPGGNAINISGNDNVVEGNILGTETARNQSGVFVTPGSNNRIGGTTPAARNVIAGVTFGVILAGGATGCNVQGNYIGTDLAGNAAVGNGGNTGILIGSFWTGGAGVSNTIGGTTAGARNIIAGAFFDLVQTSGEGNLIQGNYLGTDVTGTSILIPSNLERVGHGVQIAALSNTVGGTSPAARNLIAGAHQGVRVAFGTLANTDFRDTIVQGNYIGTRADGAGNLGTIEQGIFISGIGPVVRVGGTAAGAGNVISNSGKSAIEIADECVAPCNNPGTGGHTVQGNLIGTDASGMIDLGNTHNGVYIRNVKNNVIGGTSAGARNVISGNGLSGVLIESAGATGNIVAGNYIGTNAAGTVALGNDLNGVTTSQAPNNTIGGATVDARNIISANARHGISIGIDTNSGASGVTVQNNYIGTDLSGINCMGNGRDGVFVNRGSVNHTITDNLITCNGRDGVNIPNFASNDPGIQIRVIENAIFGNASLGIDLGDAGITANDPQDTDSGANLQQNFPVLTSAGLAANSDKPDLSTDALTINGALNSAPNQTFTLHWYFSTAGQCASNQANNRPLVTGKVPGVTTNGNGDAQFSFPFDFPAGVDNGIINCTATDSQGNTSEFSACFQLGAASSPTPTPTPTPGPTPLVQFSAASFSGNENSGPMIVTVSRVGNSSGQFTVNYATSDTGNPTNCSAAFTGKASSRCDYTTAIGTLRFASGETAKNLTILIIDDSYSEAAESLTVTLADPVGASLGSTTTATATINDDELPSQSGPNPINQPGPFVRFHYYDFLNREPDTPGLNFWRNEITSCGSDTTCTEVHRISVSASFFLSIEFKETGYLVERAYKASYGDIEKDSSYPPPVHKLKVPIIRFQEFLADTQQITEGVIVLAPGWEQKLESNKVAFFADFVQRARFTTALPTTLTPAQFVDQLNTNAGNILSTSERTTAINLFSGAGNTANTTARAQALRQVAEDTDLATAEINRAFVLMQYYGYLRRNPDDPPEATLDYAGYEFWLIKLNLFGGDYSNAEMVKAFLSSIEYNRRFGP
jgi:Calx-beta domain